MKWVGPVLTGLLATAPANAASFDCKKADTKVEHLICDNYDLSMLDLTMANRYKSTLKCGAQRGDLARTQREWLSRRNHCTDVACVKDAYFDRLLDFEKMQCEAKGAHPADEGSRAAAVPENATSEQDKVREIMTSHHFSLSLVREKSSEPFCKAFLDDFRAMNGITFLKPEIESDSYSDKRWDAYKARCPDADLFEGYSCDSKTQEYVDTLPEEEQRAEEMESCQLFRCTQTFRLFKVTGKGYSGPAFDAFYCEHSRGPLNFANTDRDMGGGYQFIDPRHCSSRAFVATADSYSFGAHHPLGNHSAIIFYKGNYFVFELHNLSEGEPDIRPPMREYTLTVSGGLDLSSINYKLPELELPTITPICMFSSISKSNKK